MEKKSSGTCHQHYHPGPRGHRPCWATLEKQTPRQVPLTGKLESRSRDGKQRRLVPESRSGEPAPGGRAAEHRCEGHRLIQDPHTWLVGSASTSMFIP